MKKRILVILTIIMSIVMCKVNVQASIYFTSNNYIEQDGYYYQLWKDVGNTTLAVDDLNGFNCFWNNINNALFRKGKKLNIENSYSEIGNITVEYSCDFEPKGTAYLAVYGMKHLDERRILEYYIVENWGAAKPNENLESLGTITVDDGTYDIYKTNPQVSISGMYQKTVTRYWSVRNSKRTEGRVSVTEHFKAWENLGLSVEDMDDVSFLVEGFQSNGKAIVKCVKISIGEFIVGDLNGDGETNSIDFGMLRKYILGYIDGFDYEHGLEAADVNGDGNINSIDLAIYRNFLLGAIPEFPKR